MSAKALFYTLLLAGTALEIWGDLLFKRWIVEGRQPLLYWGLAVYMIGAALWACSLRYAPLAKAAAVFAVANTAILTLGGMLLFQERLTSTHWFGIGLGVLSVVVLEAAE